MILGYENQIMAHGETGDSTAAKCLVETWDQ
jgi:hypothetical protein